MKTVNYLDVTLYKPYKKQNGEMKSIPTSSDYQPSIIEHVLKSTATRLSSLSQSNKKYTATTLRVADTKKISYMWRKMSKTKNKQEKPKETDVI